MNQATAVIKHRKIIVAGLAGILAVILQVFVFVSLANFYTDEGLILIGIVVLLEIAISIWMIIKGLSEEYLDETGLAFKTPFGTKHYSWSDVESYGVEIVQTKKGTVPRIRICFREEKRKAVLEYREDVVQCLRRYRGLPAYDKWEQQST